MVANLLWVTLGGALGSVARYALALALKPVPGLPWGTLGANVLGCFLIGLFMEWAGTKSGLDPQVKLFLTTGFCGGFTTLSSLMFETNTLFRDQDWGLGALYIGLSLVVPFAALWAGIGLVKLVTR